MMKKILLLCCVLAVAICLVAFAKDQPVGPSTSVTGPNLAPANSVQTEYDYVKQLFTRMQEGSILNKEEQLLVEKYFPPTPAEGGSPLDAIGGPDGSYYYYADNMAGGPDTVTFGWIELCGDPLAVNATGVGDEGTTTVTLPWAFPFYGTNNTIFTYQVNGWIQFNSTTQPNSYTPPCPWASLTHTTRIIAAFYRDQNAAAYGGCNGNGTAPWMRHRIDADKVIIEWKQVPMYGSTTVRFEYEAILYADGRIKLQYNATPTGLTVGGAVGIDGITATDGVSYACGLTEIGTKIAAGRAVWFYRELPPIPELSVSNLSPCGNVWPANPAVPVSFRVTNNGLATSAPVTAYYDFNLSGTTDIFNVPPIAPNSFFDVFFTVPINVTVPGSYLLKGWFLPHDNPSTNDSTVCTVILGTVRPCAFMAPADANLDPMPNVPWAGTISSNCGNGGKWNGSFTAVMGLDYHFDLCPDAPGAGTSNFDIDIKIVNPAGTILAGQDGSCLSPFTFRPNNFTWTATGNGTFYVVLAPYPSSASHTCTGTVNSTFTMEYYEALPCIVECPPNGIPEGEPICANEYVDAFNGGCNSVPPVFSPIECGQTICGKAGTYLFSGSNYRDTDWYVLTLTERDSVRWTVNAEFAPLVGILNEGCPAGAFIVSAVGSSCLPTTVARCLEAGTYYLFAGPSVFTGIPCDADYVANLECLPCLSPPCPFPNRDVEPANNTCGNNPPVNCGEWLCGRILTAGDNDFYTLTLTERDTVTIYAYGDDTPGQWPFGQGLDPYVVLYGAACDSITYDDDGGDGLDSKLVRACMDPGTYYVKVKGYSGTSVGPYVLRVTCAPCCTADQQVTLTPGDPNFPAPQNVFACAHLVAGTNTVVQIPVHNESNVPNVVISSGCSVDGECYDPNCVPLTDWVAGSLQYSPTPPTYSFTLTAAAGATGCCVCLHLDNILSVELVGFSAVAGDRSVTLNWTTASETNNDKFELLRDGVQVAEIDAKGSTQSGASYAWTDNDLTNGTSYSYSLVAVDINGGRDVLGTVQSTPVASLVITEYALHQNYPNPFNPTTSITFDLVDGGMVTLKVYNVVGQAVATLVNGSMTNGRHTVSFDATGMPSGLYIYRIETTGFVSQHKMLLMK